jgi:hypothetical protein
MVRGRDNPEIADSRPPLLTGTDWGFLPFIFAADDAGGRHDQP